MYDKILVTFLHFIKILGFMWLEKRLSKYMIFFLSWNLRNCHLEFGSTILVVVNSIKLSICWPLYFEIHFSCFSISNPSSDIFSFSFNIRKLLFHSVASIGEIGEVKTEFLITKSFYPLLWTALYSVQLYIVQCTCTYMWL